MSQQYTLRQVQEAAERLQRDVKEILAEWRERALLGDPAAKAALEEWERWEGEE